MVSKRAQLQAGIGSERNKTVSGYGAEERIRPAPRGWRSTSAGRHTFGAASDDRGHFYSAQ